MAPVTFREAEVQTQEEVAPGVFCLWVEGEYTARPGQFFLLRAWRFHPLLSRPFSVFDLGAGYIAFLYAVRGEGTRLLARLRPGHSLFLFGPLGNGWERAEGKVALVGGGMGLAPLLYTAKAFGPPLDIYLGFRERPFLVDLFALYGTPWVSSEQLSDLPGVAQGMVTDLVAPHDYSAVYACGPQSMLLALFEKCRAAGVPLFVSLEERLACGVGACLGCTILTRRGPARLCRDGPVFPAEEVFGGT